MNVKEPKPASKSKVLEGRRVAAAVPPAPSAAELDKWIKKARRLPAVRKDLIKRVKAQIAAGTYESSEKLESAIKHLLKDIE